eukprot:6213146-Pleurochrysis_carterae.AAC.2
MSASSFGDGGGVCTQGWTASLLLAQKLCRWQPRVHPPTSPLPLHFPFLDRGASELRLRAQHGKRVRALIWRQRQRLQARLDRPPSLSASAPSLDGHDRCNYKQILCTIRTISHALARNGGAPGAAERSGDGGGGAILGHRRDLLRYHCLQNIIWLPHQPKYPVC